MERNKPLTPDDIDGQHQHERNNLSDLTARVEHLERQLARLTGTVGTAELTAATELETRGTQPPTSQTSTPAAEFADPYFALNALKRVLPAPGGVVFAGNVDLPGGRHVDWQYGLPTDTLIDEDWSARAESVAALGHPVRLQLVQEILLGMATVAELAQIDGLGTSGQVYHHLRTLTAAGWLQSTGRGRYEVPLPRIVPLLVLILAARR